MSKRYSIYADRKLDMQIRQVLGLASPASLRDVGRSTYESRSPDPHTEKPEQSDSIVIMNSAVLSRYKARDANKLGALRKGRKLLVVVTEETVTRVIEALQIADGVVFQSSNLRNLPRIITLMEENHMSVPPGVLSIMLERGLRRKILLSLTRAEQRTLSLLGHGCTNSIIAATLDISEGRAKYLIRSLLKKLLLQNRTQAAVFAAREIKLIDAPPPPPPSTRRIVI